MWTSWKIYCRDFEFCYLIVKNADVCLINLARLELQTVSFPGRKVVEIYTQLFQLSASIFFLVQQLTITFNRVSLYIFTLIPSVTSSFSGFHPFQHTHTHPTYSHACRELFLATCGLSKILYPLEKGERTGG